MKNFNVLCSLPGVVLALSTLVYERQNPTLSAIFLLYGPDGQSVQATAATMASTSSRKQKSTDTRTCISHVVGPNGKFRGKSACATRSKFTPRSFKRLVLCGTGRKKSVVT